jgi:hypothetical protein
MDEENASHWTPFNHEPPMSKCDRCGTEGKSKTWQVESRQFRLCGDCNPKLYRLISDWLKLGWTDIPAREYVK